ncbi:MFS family permease [Brevundimonas alba]|uniref:MFS family permease n=1 Tax=Brevundimonas alba TaxID=74314 RepID=A0A7X5YKB0_9CAUL|nr:MFS transporter [Brevundimonas alba]NJC41222.1 MFS family permease [Brevundimonas alba]
MERAANTEGETRQPSPVSRVFMGLYALAQIGGFIAFVPMLNILLPLKAGAIDPAGKAILLSQVSLWGALAAGLANLAAGALSDGTRGRFGRRRPWIVVGTLAVVAAHGLVFAADSMVALLAGFLLFQLTVNIMFGPLNAILPDMVPDRQKGLVSALAGLAPPAAGLFAGFGVAVLLTGLGSRFGVVAAAILLLILPFALWVREPKAGSPAGERGPLISFVALRDHDYLMAFLSRLFVQVTMTLNVLYLLFYLQEVAVFGDRFAGRSPESILGWLLAAGTLAALAAGMAGGVLSDRLGRRRVFVMAGGLAMAAGAGLMALAPEWPGPLAAQILFGAGLGLYSTVDIALVAEVLPDRNRAGRDLGLMNVAITVPQVIAPLLGLLLLAEAGRGLPWLFAASSLFGLAGALIVMRIRRVR